MQMPNFCYGIALLVDSPCRTTDLQNAKRKVRRATAAAVLVLWQVGYQASLQCRRHAHGDEPTKGTTGDGAARLVSLFSRARALTHYTTAQTGVRLRVAKNNEMPLDGPSL